MVLIYRDARPMFSGRSHEKQIAPF